MSLRESAVDKVNHIFRLNQVAMGHLRNDQKPSAFRKLLAAEAEIDAFKAWWYEHREQLGDLMVYTDAVRTQTMTYNNLGVYFKMLKKHNQAIKYLKQVLSIEQEMLEVNPEVDVTEVCQTNVNICTIYSEMGKHEIALSYVENAVKILDKEYEERIT